VAALFFLALGVVGQFRVPLHWIERVLMITASAVMAVCPLGWSIEGILPLLCAGMVAVRNLWISRGRQGAGVA